MKISQAKRPSARSESSCAYIVELWQLGDETCRSCDNILTVTVTATTIKRSICDKAPHERRVCVCVSARVFCVSVSKTADEEDRLHAVQKKRTVARIVASVVVQFIFGLADN